MAKRSRSNTYLDDQNSDPSHPHLSDLPSKIIVPSPEPSSEPQTQQLMRCSLPPHKETITFSTYDDYESHYLKTHVNRCSECGKNFPTQHILNIHIEENHDPLILARRDRGEKTFSCLVEGCDRKCSTAQKRRRHLIDKHMFPRNYNFFIINDGIDKQNSLLRTTNHGHHRRLSLQSPQEGRLRYRKTSISSTSPANAKEEVEDIELGAAGDDEVDVLTSSLSALRFVPASVTKRLGSERK
ncbi:hypothetical protein EYB25_000182 [Talaromyces marneffei]|uniref:C2H2-type domain-containing protein n=1 Tax=Talaromyces marneffei (strain ATCC 18224 / CBS 334.59 / QM 7333) TaxID=441960 RepID=B6Q1Q3_TALMQ|nr:uncharacterized protein EYB26_002171 [Talaromyces marneffei]EEA28906.1 conserved hypothetical protein [Talaromyces marneffei ATCC 18224]KAE8555486.1 hypothetical protein EYB25_000182 [Talaromyces marneffei]QGA14516.1 hypothetical protein EYB26_002171 [Talaromyces marneffei]